MAVNCSFALKGQFSLIRSTVIIARYHKIILLNISAGSEIQILDANRPLLHKQWANLGFLYLTVLGS